MSKAPLNSSVGEPGEPGALDTFRAEVRAFIELNCPPLMRTPPASESEDVWGGRRAKFFHPDARLWLSRMAEAGYTAPTWPKEFGGAGLSHAEAAILDEELKAHHCRFALKSFGVWMLGPVLLRFGNDEQKREHLPKIARGETRWCQGYSEPAAGSDLASLSTSAVLDGDEYVVNGQKVWTSHADHADFIFCLVRTGQPASRSAVAPSFAAAKHEGISFLLIDMTSPGVSVRPITLISGASPFCETFFDGVRVPKRNLVGPEGGGWTIAKALLEHERALIGKLRNASVSVEEPLEDMARRYQGESSGDQKKHRGPIADPILRDRITQANLDALCNQLTLQRSAESVARGRAPGPETSMFKLYGTELSKRRKELKVLIAGWRGLGWEGEDFRSDELRNTRDWLRSRASSIEGGTSEIQLNIIAKRVLGLPD